MTDGLIARFSMPIICGALAATIFCGQASAAETGSRPPDAFRGIKWDSPLPAFAALRKKQMSGCATIVEQQDFDAAPPCSHMHMDGDDIDSFSQNRSVPPLFGVAVSEQMFVWSNKRFWSGQVFIHDYTAQDLQKLRSALVQQYGAATFTNDSLHLTKWVWPEQKIEIVLDVDPVQKRSIGSKAPPQTSISLSFSRME